MRDFLPINIQRFFVHLDPYEERMMKQRKHPLKKTVIYLVLIAAIGSFAFRDDLFSASKNLDIFASLYKELNIHYVDEVDPAHLIRTGIDAMLSDLDPYTEYVPESEMENYKLKYVSTQYGGIGASIFQKDEKIVIGEPYEGFPAQKADLRAGDEIVQINDIPVKDKTTEDVSNMLKGPKSTTIKVLIKRPGSKALLEKTITRQEIIQRNVSYYGMLQNGVGYIKLDKFLENSAQEVKDALTDLQKNNPKGLILDLRYNGGGILQEAVKIVNLFVEKDVVVVSQKSRKREKEINYKTAHPAAAPSLPLIVLVNGRSASASEIVAGSLQDLDRAVIIGQRSFGKGLVQQTFNLPYNSLVKVTVAKYYTPSGRCIQALDYSHRNSDGSVEKLPDSLITEFKTKGGRSVYNGNGIYPDIFVKPYQYHQITQTLISRYFIFDYATQFRNSKSSISNPKQFKLSDAAYNEFVNYLSDKDYNYSTPTEQILKDLKLEAEKENKLDEIQTEYNALKNKIFHAKNNDLKQYKDEIRRMLESEIVSRYYFQNGRLEQSFQYDPDVHKALDVLADNAQLNAILKGEGSYKSIGKPGEVLSANSGE